MDDWQTVRWAEAAQVTAYMDLEPADRPPADGMSPAAFFTELRARGRGADALEFLGLSLPRLEAVQWAAAVLADEARDRHLPPADRQALDHSLRWLVEPGDAHRRAAYRAGQAAGPRTPERALTLAIFFSGGSISEPGLPAVLPAPELAGRYAAGAVRLAALRAERAAEVEHRALDLGARVAAEGASALPPL